MYRFFSAISVIFLVACVEKLPQTISSNQVVESIVRSSEDKKLDQRLKIYDHAVKICLEASAAILNAKTTVDQDAILCRCGNKFILANDGEGSLSDIWKENLDESGKVDVSKYIANGGTRANAMSEKCNKEAGINN